MDVYDTTNVPSGKAVRRVNTTKSKRAERVTPAATRLSSTFVLNMSARGVSSSTTELSPNIGSSAVNASKELTYSANSSTVPSTILHTHTDTHVSTQHTRHITPVSAPIDECSD